MRSEELKAPSKKLKTQDLKLRTLNEIGEFGLIKRIRGLSLFTEEAKRSRRGTRDSGSETVPKEVLVGIGDDAAVVIPPVLSGGKGGITPLLVTTDSLIEDIHFRRHYPPEALGWKALTVNISDISAMGGMPKYYLLSLSIPGDISLEYVDRLLKGMADAARRYGLSLIGGDTTSSPQGIYISIVVLGRASNKVLLRSGAGPGDVLFVTGTLGDSALGLKILEDMGVGSWESGVESKKSETQNPKLKTQNFLIQRHLKPTPRVKEGLLLAKTEMVTSMIDISDGLLADLGHICEESNVGAKVWLERLPLSKEFNALSGEYGGKGVALSGGEDYELLFTVRENDVPDFLRRTKSARFTPIGKIMKRKGIRIADTVGADFILDRYGYEHFRS